MSWKNLKQRSLADALLTEHKVLTELDDVYELIDWNRIETMLKDIHNNRPWRTSVATVIDVQSYALAFKKCCFSKPSIVSMPDFLRIYFSTVFSKINR